VKCDEVAAVVPDYLTDALDARARDAVQLHLAECDACRSELEGLSETWARLRVLEDARPSPALRAGFYAMLEAYPRDAEEAPPPPPKRTWWARWPWTGPLLQPAAAVLALLLGFALGRFSQGRAGGPTVGGGTDGPTAGERTPLALIRQPSAGERLEGVTLASRMERPDQALLDALLDTVDNDPNVNVRLSAVEALYLFSHEPRIRERLTESLARQTSPVVQIALIDLLVASREKQAAAALGRLVKDRQARPEVREHAESGLRRLL
jgi:hypothetical protein